ncbi:MAG: hypothetical protein O3A46_14240, partial [Candidatus Poribacteria bacterium]|nr:hypothetical protein [Candidatus Poribacteria bacterium]
CPWMLHKETAGGGCMINFGTHFFDLFLELTQEPIKRVFCQTSNKLHGHSVEDVASVLMQTHSGANATLESGYLLPDDPKEDIISLSAKNAYAGNDKKRWSFPTITFRDGRVSRVLEDEPTYGDYVEETIRRFEADEKPIANVRSMVRVLDCVNAAYESARTGQPVSPLNEWW